MVSKEEILRAAQEVKDADGRYCRVSVDGDRLVVEVNVPTNEQGGGFLCDVSGESALGMSVGEIAEWISECLNTGA